MKKLLSIVLTALFILSFGTLCFADELPYWYPEDVEAFEDYHAENAPRVVDDADIFSDDEEEDLEVSILKSVEENGEEFLEAIEDDAELEEVYSALMDLIYEEDDAPEA